MSKLTRQNLSSLTGKNFISTAVKYGTQIIFIMAVAVLSYLSFVEEFAINASIRNITVVAIISAVLNWILWDMGHIKQYNSVLDTDINNTDYNIHKRYYYAKSNISYSDCQSYISKHNKEFKESWIRDVEELTGRTRHQIKNEGYKKQNYKFLIWRIKHDKYPKSGLKTPRDVLHVLNVKSVKSGKINVNAAERYHTAGRIKKAFTVILSMLLVASLVYEFISGNVGGAFLKLILNVVFLFLSLFFGSIRGQKSGKIKLETAEEICELLEDWKKEPPTEVPFKEEVIVDTKVDVNIKEEVTIPTLEIL